MQIELPISKSIVNRWLILQAIHGDELMPVSADLPEDVRIMSEAIRQLGERREARIDIGNCGTAMRFLTAYCAQLDGTTVILDGVERMRHRPIGQLVDTLREIGAQIDYLGEEGYPPLRIKGCILDKQRLVTINNPQSTQFVSALLLIGANVQTNSTSPYITLTRTLIERYAQHHMNRSQGVDCERNVVENNVVGVVDLYKIERDWSSAAFWYEYVALHGGEITLPGLSRESLQGDKIVADIFAHLGIHTTYTAEGAVISSSPLHSTPYTLNQDFASCPDLYPAVALTCERLGVTLHATGVESLPWKESDRLRAVAEHRTDADHRMAMALLIAGYEVEDTACISKSYPQFIEQWNNVIRSHA